MFLVVWCKQGPRATRLFSVLDWPGLWPPFESDYLDEGRDTVLSRGFYKVLQVSHFATGLPQKDWLFKLF